ncbi:MAG: hypothetical protein UY33_C0003G0039 [Candidatus Amesbacteria bacterium GW2011_GWA1_48_9]|uniref:Uncharacterized protein n=1 Tax=Candidatus Amesbacteria bacterium GW2011_GWA1_48_9 TaxID=1618355 RepID=A0A0G1V3D4_9BACT|nr:MAG: hypothetical protein UY33_C0003G0039 [Candidatus Amesbacteria bacterium GW2011_GWA1_48_9]
MPGGCRRPPAMLAFKRLHVFVWPIVQEVRKLVPVYKSILAGDAAGIEVASSSLIGVRGLGTGGDLAGSDGGEGFDEQITTQGIEFFVESFASVRISNGQMALSQNIAGVEFGGHFDEGDSGFGFAV